MTAGVAALVIGMLAALLLPTPSASAQAAGQIAINEIFYHPPCLVAYSPCPDAPAEFIELVNVGSTTRNISGWEFVDGVDYQFPAGTSIAPGGFIVVADNLSGYSNYFSRTASGQWSGGLSNGGERIALANASGVLVDEVSYSDGGETPGAWSVGADGNGESLSLSSAANNDGNAWWWDGASPTPDRTNANDGAAPMAIVDNFTWTVLPAANQSTQVSADVFGGSNVSFQYKIGYPGTTQTIPMTRGAGNRWTGTIPSSAYSAGDLIRFRLFNGGTVIAPTADDSIDWVGTTVADPSVTSNLPVLEWFTSNTNYNNGYAEQGDTLYDGVLAYNGEVWDNVSFRIRGQIARSSAWTKRNWKFKFPDHHDFRIDGISYGIDSMDLQGGFADEARIREFVGHTVADQMGLVASQVQHVQLRLNGNFFGLHTLQEHPEGGFLKDNNLPNATLFKRASGATYEAGPPASPPSSVNYENWDIPEYINLLAAASVIQNNDFAHGNFYWWLDRDEHQRHEGMVWDLDLSQGIRYSPTSGLTTRLEDGGSWSYVWHRWKNQAPMFAQVLSSPYRELYLRRLRTLADEWFGTGRYEQVAREAFANIGNEWDQDVARWGFWGGQSYTKQGAINRLADTWVDQYYAHIRAGGPNGDIPGPQPTNPSVQLIVEPDPGDARLEHIRIRNNESTAIDISGWQISGSTTLTMPPGSVLPSNGSAYVVGDDRSSGFRAATSNLYVLGEYSTALNDANGQIDLLKPNGQIRTSASWGVGAPTAGLILNEWNAVSASNMLTGSDTYFGSVPGNGGDWFELVVVEDHLDVRGWQLELTDSDSGVPEITDVFTFANDALLADLRVGTIITISEDVPDDVSFSPAGDDWWINLQAETGDAGAYFTAASQSNFNTDNDDWQLRIVDSAGNTRFGPAGEGIGVASGISSTEVGELEEDPGPDINALSLYDDGNDSTFGSPNGFDAGFQDFSDLRDWFNPGRPVSVIASPVDGAEFVNNAVLISGSSTDDVGVASVGISVQNDAGLYLRPNGSFAAGETSLPASLDAPGARSTDWSLPITVPSGSYLITVAAVDGEGFVEPAQRVRFSVLDTDAPSTPGDFVVVDRSSTTVTLSWSDAVDDVGVQSYQLYRDGVFAGVVDHPTTQITDAGLAPGTSFLYQVVALDAAGNESELSLPLITTTRVVADGPFTAIAYGDVWSYLDNGSNQGTAWRQVDFNDASWAAGPAQLGYGDGDESTVVSFGPDANSKYITTYLRREFVGPEGIEEATLNVIRDDGVAVYINGTRIVSDNLPASFNYLTPATTALAGADESEPVPFAIPAGTILPGTNVIAVEIHQASGTSSDISFNLELSGIAADGDSQTPTTVTATPGADEELPGPDVTFEGAATDDVGVTGVALIVRDVVSGDYLQSDGSFATAVATLDATLASPGAVDTDWSYDVTLPDGQYELIVSARDAAGNAESNPAVPFEVVEADDVTAPVSVVSAPLADDVLADPAVTFAGTTTDDVGVARVRLIVRNLDTGEYLQTDGSLAAEWRAVLATLDSPGATETTWTYNATLPDGRYLVTTRANDDAGNTEDSVRTEFEVTAAVDDTTAPVSVVSAPLADDVLADPAVTFAGTTTDDVGVARVRLIVRNLDTGEYLQTDGSLAAEWRAVLATLDSPGATETTWTYDATLPDGRYLVTTRANDDAGNTEDPVRTEFEVTTPVDDITPPVTTVSRPVEGDVLADGSVIIGGNTTDDVAVSRVRIAIQDLDSLLWLQADGSFAAVWSSGNAVLTSPDAADTDWAFDADLPDARYRVSVKSFDLAGNSDSSVRVRFDVTTGAPDSEAPVSTIATPVDDAIVGADPVVLTGNSTDNVGVNRLRVAMLNLDEGLWLQADGTLGPVRYFADASLASPGEASTDWSYSVSLPDARYRAIVKANDATGNTESAVRREFEVEAGGVDLEAPESTISSDKDQVVGAVTFEGGATDNVGVTEVKVWIRNRDNLLWLQADGSLGADRVAFTATLVDPAAAATDWSIDLSLPSTGRYRILTQAVDAADNAEDPLSGLNLVVS